MDFPVTCPACGEQLHGENQCENCGRMIKPHASSSRYVQRNKLTGATKPKAQTTTPNTSGTDKKEQQPLQTEEVKDEAVLAYTYPAKATPKNTAPQSPASPVPPKTEKPSKEEKPSGEEKPKESVPKDEAEATPPVTAPDVSQDKAEKKAAVPEPEKPVKEPIKPIPDAADKEQKPAPKAEKTVEDKPKPEDTPKPKAKPQEDPDTTAEKNNEETKSEETAFSDSVVRLAKKYFRKILAMPIPDEKEDVKCDVSFNDDGFYDDMTSDVDSIKYSISKKAILSKVITVLAFAGAFVFIIWYILNVL